VDLALPEKWSSKEKLKVIAVVIALVVTAATETTAVDMCLMMCR